ncbi:MAG: hypothetical protein OEY51_13580 [Cyclobacteriaceae bacterium]|nr:hypothetical protein [Cyclobacteriaceae bacterium]
MNHWNIPGVPHRGWCLESVYDIREDGQSIDETAYEECMMCGNERIRYVHVVTHPEISENFNVGCVCAEKMTNDYVNPRRIENSLRNKASRRISWAKRTWKHSKNGNLFFKKDGHLFIIFRDKKSGKYKGKIDGTFGKKSFQTTDEAKIALFNGMEHFKQKGEC